MANIHDHITNFLSKIENPVVFEAGIHHGEDTTIILHNLSNCKFYGFEPDPRNIQYIQSIGLDKRIFFTPKALSNSIGMIDFYLSNSVDNWDGSSSIKKPKLHLQEFKHITFDDKVKVPTITIDDFCEANSIDHIDFLWLDTQGAEEDIINGAFNMLKKIKYIYFEFYNTEIYENQPRLNDILDILGNNWQTVEKYNNEILVANYDFIMKDK